MINILMKIWFCTIAFANSIQCFNIAITEENTGYFLSPLQQRLRDQATMLPKAKNQNENIEAPKKGPIPSKKAASFFGYNFDIRAGASGSSIFVGAPKTVDPSRPFKQGKEPIESTVGDIRSCPAENVFSRESSPFCHSTLPPNPKKGDAHGLSLGVFPNGQVTACSPQKVQNCSAAVYSPGYCYRRKTKGKWAKDQRTKNIECPPYSLDLLFLLDGSGSVGMANFELIKEWLKEVTRSFDLARGSARIGVIQYSHYYEDNPLDDQDYFVTEIALGEHTDQNLFFNAVDKINASGYTTFTAHALNYSVLEFKASSRYNSATKVLILLTDGKSSDKDDLPASASFLRSTGINTFAVGVGNADVTELQTVATGTDSNKNVYYVSEFDKLAEIVQTLKTAVLTVALEGSVNSSRTALSLQVAETGFSLQPSKNTKGNRKNPVYECVIPTLL